MPTRALLTGVYLHDSQLGWAVGHDAVVLRTRDGGTTWERVHDAPENGAPAARRLVQGRRAGPGHLRLRRAARHERRRRLVASAPHPRRRRLPLEPDRRRGRRHALHRRRGRPSLPLGRRRRDLARAGFALRGVLLRPAAARRRPRARLRAARPPVRVGRSRQELDADRDRDRGDAALRASRSGPGRFVVAGMEGTLVWGESASGPRPHRAAARPPGHRRPRARPRTRPAARSARAACVTWSCHADAEAHPRRPARAADLRPPPRGDRSRSSWPRPCSAGRPRACASTPASPSCCRSSTRTWRRS